MLSSISPVGEATRGQRWWLTAAAYLVGSALGGAAIGGALGALGSLATAPLPLWVVAVVLGLVGAAGLVADAGLAPFGLPSRRRQVNERWLGTYRGWVYGAGFGLQLGLGVVTVVPASITYVVLAAAALSGSWLAGLAIGTVFGLTRALPLLLTAGVHSPERLRSFHRRMSALATPVEHSTRTAQGLAAVVALAVAIV
jgi:sulfite exporter TauE/SafE